MTICVLPYASVTGIGASPRTPAPMVYTFTPSAFAASAAMVGDTLPQLFWPSVKSTTTFDLPGWSRRRLTQAAIADPIAVPSSMLPI